MSRTVLLLACVSMVAVGFVVGTQSSAEAALTTRTPVLQHSRLTPAQMAAWFRAETRSPYNATVPVEELARHYVAEGKREGVAGDIAFAQAILETGWFSFPSTGQVRGTDNNFAGMGAFDGADGQWVFRFPDARTGVRAQLQHLRIYADPSVNTTGTNLGSSLARDVQDRYPDRWRAIRNDVRNGQHAYWARAQNWEDFGGGMWATDPGYSSKVLGLYKRMLDHAYASGGVAAALPFSDVTASNSHAPNIAAIWAVGWTNGCSNGTRYCPTRAVTRAEMASFLVRAGKIAPTSQHRYSDVPRSHTHHADINALAAAGFTNGCGGGRFCPDRPVTRAEMASFLQRVTGLPHSGSARFSDVAYSSTHGRAISAIADAGLTEGCGSGKTFCPKDSVTRGEMASFLRRAFLS